MTVCKWQISQLKYIQFLQQLTPLAENSDDFLKLLIKLSPIFLALLTWL